MIPVIVSMDMWYGPPYVKVVAQVKGTVHQARMTAAMDRLAKKLWGKDARSIRHTNNVYTFVWVGPDAPVPARLANIQCVTFNDSLDIAEQDTP